MLKSFAMLAPPPRKRVHVKDSDSNGAEIDVDMIAPDIPTVQWAERMSHDMIVRYIPESERKILPKMKEDPDAIAFPQGPYTGPISLTEFDVFEACNILACFAPEERPPFEEIIYMRQVAPNCYRACRKGFQALAEGDDPEGNPPAGSGSASSELQPAKDLDTIPSLSDSPPDI